MPNWVFNTVVISGEPTIMGTLREQLNAPVTKHYSRSEFIDGEWHNIADVQYYSAPVFSFWNVVAPTNLEAYYGEEKEKVGLENFMEDFNNAVSNGESWYYWNLRNWGTKWDVAVSDNDKHSDTQMEIIDGDLVYRFDTAWSPVFEIFNILAKQYPSLTFDYEYEEEQGWGGQATWKDGEMILHSEYDIPSCHADYEERGLTCLCDYEEDSEYWFDDCPKEEVGA